VSHVPSLSAILRATVPGGYLGLRERRWQGNSDSCVKRRFVIYTRPDSRSTCNIDRRSCNRFCSRKAISMTHYECMCVALGVQQAMRMRHIVIWDLPGCKIFSRLFSKTAQFSKKKIIEHKICVLISSTISDKNKFYSRKNWTRHD
jgi:hypothetical protein